jgi:hypothetical protein
MAVALFIASFMAWSDERAKFDKLDEKLKALNIQLERVTLSPEDLVRIFDGRTTAQGDELASSAYW